MPMRSTDVPLYEYACHAAASPKPLRFSFYRSRDARESPVSLGSFEFTYAELGLGSTTVTGEMDMEFEDSYAQFCVHHYNQDGLVRAT